MHSPSVAERDKLTRLWLWGHSDGVVASTAVGDSCRASLARIGHPAAPKVEVGTEGGALPRGLCSVWGWWLLCFRDRGGWFCSRWCSCGAGLGGSIG